MTLSVGADITNTVTLDKHVIQQVIFDMPENEHIAEVVVVDKNRELQLPVGRKSLPALPATVRYVKLLIHRPSTRWGSSIWRLQVWGYGHSILIPSPPGDSLA
jgi:hypothetical protein